MISFKISEAPESVDVLLIKLPSIAGKVYLTADWVFDESSPNISESFDIISGEIALLKVLIDLLP